MKDILFVTEQSGPINTQILSKTTSVAKQLYQKILILLLSDIDTIYRQRSGCNLVKLLKGSNYISDNLILTLGSNACSNVLRLLQTQDSQLVKSLVPSVSDGHLFFELTLNSGQSFKGSII